MHTRSITSVTSNGRTHAEIYLPHCGRLNVHGRWLCVFFDDRVGSVLVNRPGRLAALMVASLLEDGYDPDLLPYDGSFECEFHYNIDVQFEYACGKVTISVFDGTIRTSENRLFVGTVEEYGEFLKAEFESE